jgi:hypothetical protein
MKFSDKRERPMVTGKDAERFMEMVRKNNEYIKQRRESRNKALNLKGGHLMDKQKALKHILEINKSLYNYWYTIERVLANNEDTFFLQNEINRVR